MGGFRAQKHYFNCAGIGGDFSILFLGIRSVEMIRCSGRVERSPGGEYYWKIFIPGKPRYKGGVEAISHTRYEKYNSAERAMKRFARKSGWTLDD